MTYRQLIGELQKLTPDQLDCDVTVELQPEDECYPVKEIRIADVDHPSLDEDHPVLFVE